MSERLKLLLGVKMGRLVGQEISETAVEFGEDFDNNFRYGVLGVKILVGEEISPDPVAVDAGDGSEIWLSS